MKKLMIAAVAMAAGALFAEDITSKNIVGYMNNGDKTVAGINLFGAGFQDVGYTSVKLNSLKVTNAAGENPGSGNVMIQMVDADGVPTAIYTWSKVGRTTPATYKWQKDGVTVTDDVVFSRGTGFILWGENEGDTLASNGDVDLTACTNGTTVAGINIIANPYPTTVKVNDLKATNAAGEYPGSGNVMIQLVDADGVPTAIYTWSKVGRTTPATYKWQKDGVTIEDTVVVNPGDSVIFWAENDGDKLIFPAK